MNIVNRILVVIAILALLVGVTAACLFPDPLISQLALTANQLDDLLPRVQLVDRLILIAVAAVVDIILLSLLAMELRRPGAKVVHVQQVEGGATTLTVESIRKRLAFYIDGLQDVVSVKPRVRVKRDTVSVVVHVQTSAAVSVPQKAQEIVATIRMVVTETMGLKLRNDPQVHIRTGSYKDIALPPIPVALLPIVEEE